MEAYNQYPFMQQPYMGQQFQQPMQIQNGGFVSVRSIDEARNYPVAQGTSVTFKDELAPYVYTKTQGFSQLDRPIFEKYKLIKEEDTPQIEQPQYALQSDIESIKQQIGLLAEAIGTLTKQGEQNE